MGSRKCGGKAEPGHHGGGGDIEAGAAIAEDSEGCRRRGVYRSLREVKLGGGSDEPKGFFTRTPPTRRCRVPGGGLGLEGPPDGGEGLEEEWSLWTPRVGRRRRVWSWRCGCG
uniref:Uncharacterized protein n=1 Tax=Micrurus surinamensis TaxID=129470 RepID=A0A2D4PFX3_MICSU